MTTPLGDGSASTPRIFPATTTTILIRRDNDPPMKQRGERVPG